MTESTAKPDYKNTLNLPKTDFPMKADLPNKEPERLKFWANQGTYRKLISNNISKPKYVLHDGPPYANGHIHFGHILNKTLKDFIVKYKNMSGSLTEFIPGWDCHGLPIELQVDKDLGAKKREMSVVQIREACREYANKYVDIQREEFKRLGIFARWETPYLTMNYAYEAATLRELGKLVKNGLVYRGRKPVHWCMSCNTALAEAEVEYEDHQSPSVHVKFPLLSLWEGAGEALKTKKVSVLIWTTTPWTLAANVAVALHKGFAYVALEVAENEVLIVAEGLLDSVRKQLGLESARVLDRINSKKLEGLDCQHPFLARKSKVVLSDHVTLEAGTGCVHIAPGHGQEDYEVGLKYQLPVLNPVDSRGAYTSEVGIEAWVGKKVFDANTLVVNLLQENQMLLKTEEITHSYPHCWRCKKPVIFRSTEQWFVSMKEGDLRHRALDAIRRTAWIPPWGRDRIYGMVENRPDWCISRQRSWGVPIVAFLCKKCRQALIRQELIEKVAALFEQEGADAWFKRSAEELLPQGTKCSACAHSEFEKEDDILDVWFDSGVSFAVVLEQETNLAFPANLYLEGSDQHRGWFHSSLLAAMGTRNQAPYQSVFTHGFVVDGQGKKYSKSAKNYTPPENLIKKMGAEILRLWVAAEDYRGDIRVSDEIISRLTETYRKIRNTLRYLLGNLYDFNPAKDAVPYERLQELDHWALDAYARLTKKLKAAYESFEFHQIYHALNQFCTVELSSFYLDILKDRLYTYGPQGPERRAAQTVLFQLVKGISLWMAPLLSFTAEETWTYIAAFEGKTESVFWMPLEEAPAAWIQEELSLKYTKIRAIREEALKALELARKDKVIGSSLEAQVRLSAEGETLKLLKAYEKQWATLLIVSQALVVYEIENPNHQNENLGELQIQVVLAEGKKCERCWTYSTTVGKQAARPEVCDRCFKALM
ncbi:MAG: isoleucine--tRNA ligase [Deltaproteobacteria bacterium]|nr:isoleucine--tRNA ligase [Deltaproteobacteria bacterium]